MIDRQRRLGMQQIIASGLCFGCLGVLGKLLYQHGASAGELLALRFSLASAMLLAWHLVRNPRRLLISRSQLLSCALLGILGYALFAYCFFEALGGLSASLAILLLYTYPVLVMLGARVLLGEKIPRAKLFALPLVIGGTVALVWGDLSVARYAALGLGFAAALFYALYILLSSRLLRQVPSDISIPYIQAFAALVLAALFLQDAQRAVDLIRDAWWIIGLIALVGTVFAMGLFLAGLQKLQNWEVALLSTTEPLSRVILATMFLGERLSLGQIGGALGILLGLAWVAKPLSVRPATDRQA